MALIDLSTPMTLTETIGGILSAIVEAQQQAARATIEFINDVGLREAKADLSPELITAKFKYRKLDENNEPADFVLEVPLLSMVEIPLIMVKKATIEFSYDVTHTEPSSSTTEENGEEKKATGLAKLLKIAKTSKIKGRVAKQPASSATAPSQAASADWKAGFHVKIELEQAENPSGLDRILDMLEVSAADSKATGK